MYRREITMIMIQVVDKLTQPVYRISGGRLGGKQLGYSILLLQTIGRKSGKIRTHTLLYIRDGETLVVCASNYGAQRHPGWYLNLESNPHARIQIGRMRQEVIAETARPEERSRLWQLLLEVRPQYARYQAATSREIPVVILKPVRPSAPEGESLCY